MSGLDEKGLRAAIFPNGENPLWTDMQRGAVDETISRVVRYLAAATPADVGELVERLRAPHSVDTWHAAQTAATAEITALRARLETVEAETRELRARNDPMRVLGDPRVGVTIDEASLKELKRVLATIGGATP